VSANSKNLPKPARVKAECGTTAGYIRHRKEGQPYCEPCKEANAIYMKAYRAKQGEELKAKKRVYQQANKEKENARSKAWREANLERSRENFRRWVLENPEAKKQSDRNYKKRNLEKLRAYGIRKYHRRRASKLSNGFEFYTESEVLDLYGTCCHICSLPIDLSAPRSCKKEGWETGLHIDHVIPIARGGSDTLDNVRPSHGLCNIKKGAK